MCCACRTTCPRDDLLRFVIDTEGKLWLDPHLRAPGRGAHLCYQRECVARALKRSAFNVSFKRSVKVPSHHELNEWILNAQHRKIRDLISLSQRRRVNVSGLNMIEANRDKLLLIIFATDISEATRTKLEMTLSSQTKRFLAPFHNDAEEEANSPPNSTCYHTEITWNSAHIGHLIGRGPRVALGVTDQGIADQLNLEISRISKVLVAS